MTNPGHTSPSSPPTANDLEGLDDAFLRYIGVESETQRYIQEGYLSHFADCRRVVDLGCGDGDFLGLLHESGHECLGIDGDTHAVQRVQKSGLPVVQADVLAWLAQEADAIQRGERTAWDGLFCAHLVEHLPYTAVLSLCQQVARILRPGGVIVLATPNVAAIHAHLDGYYKHFGHITFYHPDLLSFFLNHTGFEIVETGANERVPSTLFFPVIRELNEHQVELNRLESLCEGLLPKHSALAAQSGANHSRFGEIFAGFSAVHQTIGQIHGRLNQLVSAKAAEQAIPGEDEFSQQFSQLQKIAGQLGTLGQRITSPGRLGRLRRTAARWLLGGYADVIEQTVPQISHLAGVTANLNVKLAQINSRQQEALGEMGRTLDALAQVNARMAQMAELWVGSQTIVDELDDLAARYGTILRDLGRVSRRTEEATRLLIGQIDAPFEAFVIARRPLDQETTR